MLNKLSFKSEVSKKTKVLKRAFAVMFVISMVIKVLTANQNLIRI